MSGFDSRQITQLLWADEKTGRAETPEALQRKVPGRAEAARKKTAGQAARQKEDRGQALVEGGGDVDRRCSANEEAESPELLQCDEP